MKKVIVFLPLLVVSILTIGSVYALAVHNPFTFTKLGDHITLIDSKKSGNITVKAQVVTTNPDSSLNLNLSKKKLIGYSFISLSIKDLNGSPKEVSNTWKNQSAGTYKGTITLNTNNDGRAVSGEGYLLP